MELMGRSGEGEKGSGRSEGVLLPKYANASPHGTERCEYVVCVCV